MRKEIILICLFVAYFFLGLNFENFYESYQKSYTTLKVCNNSNFDAKFITIEVSGKNYNFRNIAIGECSKEISSIYMNTYRTIKIFAEKGGKNYFLIHQRSDGNSKKKVWKGNITLTLQPDGRTEEESFEVGWGIIGSFSNE